MLESKCTNSPTKEVDDSVEEKVITEESAKDDRPKEDDQPNAETGNDNDENEDGDGDENNGPGDDRVPSSDAPPIPGRIDEASALAIFGESYMMSLSSRLKTMLNDIKATADPTTRLLALLSTLELIFDAEFLEPFSSYRKPFEQNSSKFMVDVSVGNLYPLASSAFAFCIREPWQLLQTCTLDSIVCTVK
jgi:hypothetical protein